MDYIQVSLVQDFARVSTTEDMGSSHRSVLTESHGGHYSIYETSGHYSIRKRPLVSYMNHFSSATHLKPTMPQCNSNLTNSELARCSKSWQKEVWIFSIDSSWCCWVKMVGKWFDVGKFRVLGKHSKQGRSRRGRKYGNT